MCTACALRAACAGGHAHTRTCVPAPPQLIWALQAEEQPPQEAFNPEVKRCARTRSCWVLVVQLLQLSLWAVCGKHWQLPRAVGRPLRRRPLLPTSRPLPLHTHTRTRRSGWQPPRDYGLWGPSSALLKRVLDGLAPEARAYWEAENNYFEKVTGISGALRGALRGQGGRA